MKLTEDIAKKFNIMNEDAETYFSNINRLIRRAKTINDLLDVMSTGPNSKINDKTREYYKKISNTKFKGDLEKFRKWCEVENNKNEHEYFSEGIDEIEQECSKTKRVKEEEEELEESEEAKYKVGDKITYYSIRSKRNRTNKVKQVMKKNGQIAYEMDNGNIVYQSDLELDEMNVTSNMDGGEGPPKVPGAFAKRTKETEDGAGNGELLGYRKVDKTQKRRNFKESTYKKIMGELHEISYPDYKKDDSMKAHEKVNNSIKEINRRLFEIEKIARQNVRLKTEVGVTPADFWKPTKAKLHKISERMLRVAKMLRELNS